jgi:hypothetical protein
MKQRVYIETTIVSYLTAKPSKDLVLAAHQEVTREWWDRFRVGYDLRTSQLVLNEAGKGDPKAASQRLEALEGILLLDVTDEAAALAQKLVKPGPFPDRAGMDALHMAVATLHGMDILLTWNCRHLANGRMLVDVSRFIRTKGYEIPIVCTPDELMGDAGD